MNKISTRLNSEIQLGQPRSNSPQDGPSCSAPDTVQRNSERSQRTNAVSMWLDILRFEVRLLCSENTDGYPKRNTWVPMATLLSLCSTSIYPSPSAPDSKWRAPCLLDCLKVVTQATGAASSGAGYARCSTLPHIESAATWIDFDLNTNGREVLLRQYEGSYR